MVRQIASFFAFVYVLGAAGVPLAAYNCLDCGEAGEVPVLAMSAGGCYVESCCAGEDAATDPPPGTAHCCDVEIGDTTEGQTLPPEPRNPLPVTGAESAAFVDASVSRVCITSAFTSASARFASLNLPLLI